MAKIIAIIGMPGSGKSLATEFLKKQKINVFRLGDLTDEELRRRGLKINEQNERTVREELRRSFGMAVYAQKVIEKINATTRFATNEIIALDGVKSFEEVNMLKREYGKNFTSIGLLTSPKTRYTRLAKRKIRSLTKEESISRDEKELENLNEGSSVAMADFYILNEALTKSKFEAEIRKILNSIKKQKV